MTELTIPKEWVNIRISDVANVDLGKTPKKKDYRNAGDYKVIKFRDVDYSGIDWSTDKAGFVSNDAIKDMRELQACDVLITASAHSSEHIGRKICFVSKAPSDYKKVFFCGELLDIRSEKDILNPKFAFFYFLSHTGYREIQSHIKGVHLTSGQARNMSLPFAPFSEQKHIIEIIEELFSDLDNAIENLKKAQEQLKVYRQAVLKYAFEGKLISATITWKRIGDFVDMMSGVAFKKAEYSEKGIRLFQIANVTFGKTLWDKTAYLPECYLESYPALVLKEGDVLMALNRPLLNHELKIAILGVKDVPSILYQRVGKFIFYNDKRIVKKYFYYYMRSEYFIGDLEKALQGVNIPFINKSKLMEFKIAVTDLDSQQKIVSEIESRFSLCDNLEESIDENLQKAEFLRQSILKHAFEGKLTEKWRKEHKDLISGENSAEALLRKIKAEKGVCIQNSQHC